jgi:hypothetical protein
MANYGSVLEINTFDRFLAYSWASFSAPAVKCRVANNNIKKAFILPMENYEN